jgi:hypothetical protein
VGSHLSVVLWKLTLTLGTQLTILLGIIDGFKIQILSIQNQIRMYSIPVSLYNQSLRVGAQLTPVLQPCFPVICRCRRHK